MSFRAFKCVVKLTIHELTAPGVRLANKDDLYLNVCLLGQQRRTRLVQPIFPLKFGDQLTFEKTFKFCRDETDVINFLNDLHVLIELIQLSRTDQNEVLAWYEVNAKEYLFPHLETTNFINDSQQRGVFMTKNDSFPGSISPQVIFCTSTRIDETQTPSLDILREYEERFVNEPVIDSKKSVTFKKKFKKNKLKSNVPKTTKILLNNSENFANHTISSAIKADYTLPDVKYKLEELNSSVKKTKIVKTSPGVKSAKINQLNMFKPFVVRKCDDQLILRKPELHDVLHDGLILTNKSPKRIYNKRGSRRSRSAGRSNSLSQSSRESLNEDYKTRARSLSADNNKSLNHDLFRVNRRPRSVSGSPSRTHNRTYDILPDLHDDYEHSHSEFLSNCEVCQDFDIRNQIKSRAQKNNVNNFNRNINSSAVFNSTHKQRSLSKKKKKDPLNETQLLNSDDLNRATFLDNYHGSKSFKEAHDLSHKLSLNNKKKLNHYPINQSLSNYAPPANKYDWQYSRYYPWLFNYTEYLRELEEELYWLKVRSKHLNIY